MKNKFIFIFALTFISAGCRSTKAVSGSGNSTLVIMVVDENNKAVGDYCLTLMATDNENKTEQSLTAADGFCVFQAISPGNYFLQGEKSIYTKIDKTLITVSDKGEVFCFGVTTGRGVFQKVNTLYDSGLYRQGINCLEQLDYEKNDELKKTVLLFKEYGLSMLEEME